MSSVSTTMSSRVCSIKSQALALEVNMHEVIGHASGQMAPHLDLNPEDVIKEYYSSA